MQRQVEGRVALVTRDCLKARSPGDASRRLHAFDAHMRVVCRKRRDVVHVAGQDDRRLSACRRRDDQGVYGRVGLPRSRQ